MENVTIVLASSLEKSHARSLSLVHLNELVIQKRPTETNTTTVDDTGDELNETSFRDADDNYQCLINDQNCPPVSNFSKGSTPTPISNETNATNINPMPLSAINNKDEGIVFNTQASANIKKPELNDVERFKMCGNSIII